MGEDAELGLNWAGLPVIATVARLLYRELTLHNELSSLETLSWRCDRWRGSMTARAAGGSRAEEAARSQGRHSAVTVGRPRSVPKPIPGFESRDPRPGQGLKSGLTAVGGAVLLLACSSMCC